MPAASDGLPLARLFSKQHYQLGTMCTEPVGTFLIYFNTVHAGAGKWVCPSAPGSFRLFLAHDCDVLGSNECVQQERGPWLTSDGHHGPSSGGGTMDAVDFMYILALNLHLCYNI